MSDCNLTCLQINVDIILYSNKQFDSFFDTTHTVICLTWLPHSLITYMYGSPSSPQEEFLLKLLKLTDLFTFYMSRKFILFTQHITTQHNTISPKIEGKGKNP